MIKLASNQSTLQFKMGLEFPLQPWFFFLLPLFILLPLILFKLPWKTQKNLPPSPQRLPIIGNFHQLSSTTHRSLWKLAQKHGQLMLIHLGSTPVLVASSAEAAREIMKTHDVSFSNRAKSSIRSIITYGAQDIAFCQYGEYWRQLKSLAVLQLLSNKRVQSYRHIREEETALMIDIIAKSDGSVVDMSELLMSLTNGVICRVALGRKYSGRKFKDLMRRFAELLGVFSFEDYVPWLSWIDRLSDLKGRAQKVANEFDEFLEGVIEEHLEKKMEESGKSDDGQDFVDILLQIQKENTTNGFSFQRDTIKALILDMFAAGTDTTFTNLEWALSELVRNPRVMQKLQQEVTKIGQGKSIINEDDLEEMHYLKAVFKESMRLHPPVPLLVPRESTKDVELMGYDIKAGTQVIVNAWTIGRDPSLWQEPEEFMPARFLNNPIDYKGLHFELLPFGAGRRGCPGIQFAISINELALANLVYKFDFTMAGGSREDLDMTETCGITVHKQTSLMVIATPRY